MAQRKGGCDKLKMTRGEHMTQTLMIGTTKGLFLLDTSSGALSGPHCDGWGINHAAADPESGTIWAGGGGEFWGGGVWRSVDRGQSWALTRLSAGGIDDWAANDPSVADWSSLTFDPPPPFGKRFEAVWSLNYSHGVLRAGTKGAILLESRDGGESFAEVDALSAYPGREGWNPGAAGLTLHTLVTDPGDPDKLWIGISAAGVFATEDGGDSWEARQRLSNAEDCAGHDHPAAPSGGNVGGCVHNMVRAGAAGDLLYQQNHHGVWRSADGGRSWDDITKGLPSTFGFPIGVNPEDAQMIWTIPLNGDSAGRFPPDASAAVWRSADGGASWEKMQTGLPTKDCYFTVLRQAMTTAPGGVWFGTNSGSVFGSADNGETWEEIARHLPTVLCVEAAELG